MRAFASWKLPPIRTVAGPVAANLTEATSPTDRWSDRAVVESMSISRNQGGHEQCRREKRESLVYRAGGLLYHRLPGYDLRPGRPGQGDVVLDNGLVSPRFGHDVDVVELAYLPDDGLRSREGKRSQGGPGQVGGVAKLGMPVIVYVFGGPADRMRTVWPGLKRYFEAVPASITTSCEVVGGFPSIRRSSEI